MNPVSCLIFGAVVAAFVFAVLHIVRSSRRGECVGCSECRQSETADVCPACGKARGCPHCRHPH